MGRAQSPGCRGTVTNICQISLCNKYLSNIFVQQIFVKYLSETNICQISLFFIFMHFKILPEQCPRRTPGNNFKIKISSFFICSHLCFVTAHRMNLIGDHLDQMSKLHL